MMECPSYKPKTKMNRLIPAHPFPTGENTSVDFLDEPMEKETEIDDYRHQNNDERDDEHIHEDEGCYCHGDFYLRVNDYVCKLLLLCGDVCTNIR